jgi:hypothetical protein
MTNETIEYSTSTGFKTILLNKCVWCNGPVVIDGKTPYGFVLVDYDLYHESCEARVREEEQEPEICSCCGQEID